MYTRGGEVSGDALVKMKKEEFTEYLSAIHESIRGWITRAEINLIYLS